MGNAGASAFVSREGHSKKRKQGTRGAWCVQSDNDAAPAHTFRVPDCEITGSAAEDLSPGDPRRTRDQSFARRDGRGACAFRGESTGAATVAGGTAAATGVTVACAALGEVRSVSDAGDETFVRAGSCSRRVAKLGGGLGSMRSLK